LDRLDQIVVSLQERSRTLVEMAESAAHFFLEEIVLDTKAEAILTKDALSILMAISDRLFGEKGVQMAEWNHPFLKEAFQDVCVLLGLKLAQVAQPIRAAVTGKTVSPGIFDVLEMLGAEKTRKRLQTQIDRISSSAGTCPT
jgi:glutamyl-tRNA synthetase